ncbi:MAG: DDE-type integrase/transposase/recombinase [Firmicutes bacterium]|nr:DDE-type integrase/transposase/recombinase [Candidatus Fermentithermobacillaceae bacterium]
MALAGPKQRKEPGRKRFAYEKVNAMWQADISSGPYIKMGKRKVPTFLFAFLDDASRLVPYALYTPNQGFDSLKTVFKEALSRRGIPQMIYADNGKIYTSQQFQWVCASLGIALVHTKPYDPSAKGKIERFFLSVRQRFLSALDYEGLTLDSLNESFLSWLEKDYNSRPHSAIGMSPIDMYMSQSSSLKMLDDPSVLEPLFLRREIRKVRHDSTISVQNHLFEVPPALVGKRVEVRFDPDDLSEVLIYDEGVEVARTRPVNLHENARVKREKPALRLSELDAQEE